MVTPFDDDLALDLDGAATLARWLVDHGVDGLVLAGTTGESPTVTDDEKLNLFRAVRDAVTVPVIAGTGSNDTRHSVELTERASALGVDGILAVTPYYNRPSQAGLHAHFSAVAGATDLPVMIYDIPVRTGRKVETDTLLGLAREVDNILAVKDAAGDSAESARLIAQAPGGFELYSGEDRLNLPLLSVGAVGVVSVAGAWSGRLHAEMIAAYRKGDVDTAREVNNRLRESYDFESSDEAPNPVPVKAMLRALGLPVGECRLPMGPAPAGLEERARRIIDRLGAP